MAELPDRVIGTKFPQYDSVASRLATFEGWPRVSHLRPKELAEAGFFYSDAITHYMYIPEHGDSVKCYSCEVELSQRTHAHDAWAEHERLKPSCEHVLSHKISGLSLGNEVVQGHQIQASGDDSHSMLQHYDASNHALHPGEEDPIQEKQDVSEGDEETPEEELERLRLQFVCKTCFKEKACFVFLPCTHLSACPACTAKLENCNVCQEPIKATIKAYCA